MSVNGFKYKEIAELTGLSIGTIKSRIFYCKRKLKRLLGNSAKRIYPFEIKRVRRITLFSGNELATVLIAVVCIALPIRVTLTDAKIRNEIEFIYFCVQFYQTK